MIIAQQLTLLTLSRFSSIHPRHFIRKTRTTLAPSHNQMRLSNAFTLSIASHILHSPTSTSRHETYCKWVKIASILFQLCNWNGVFEVIYALTHHAVWRLGLRQGLTGEEGENMTKLCLFVSTDDNYGVYRRVMRAKGGSNGWKVPYLGLVLKDLVAMEESQIVVRVEGGGGVGGGKREGEEKKREEVKGRAIPSASASPSTSFSTPHSIPSSSHSVASVSSASSLSSINSIASTDSAGSINVDSVESDLFGDDNSGSLVLPSLLSASLHTSGDGGGGGSGSGGGSGGGSGVSHSGPAQVPGPVSPDLVFVNVVKCQQIHSLIEGVLTLPSHPPYHAQGDVQRLLEEMQRAVVTERQLMERSLAIQPKKVGSGGSGSPGVDESGRRGMRSVRAVGSSSPLLLGGGASPGRTSPLRSMAGLRVSASSSAIHSLTIQHREGRH